MAIGETTLKDVMPILIEQQNTKGGLLGKKLISADKCAAVFGCSTSVSRKSGLRSGGRRQGRSRTE